MAKRKLQDDEELPPKRKEFNYRLPSDALHEETHYRGELVKFCSPIHDRNAMERMIRICSIVRFMQLDFQNEYFWSALPHELIRYLFERCDSITFRNPYKIVQYDLFGRLNGGQFVCSPNGYSFHDIPRLETNLLNLFNYGPNHERLRVIVKHCGTRIASIFFYRVDGRNFGFEFRRKEPRGGYYFRYYHDVTTFYGLRIQTYKDSKKFQYEEDINTNYNSYLAMLDEFPSSLTFSRKMSRSDVAWVNGQIPNLKNYFIFIVDLLKKHWEPLKHSVV